MSDDIVPVNIQILEKEYMVSCPAGAREDLVASARILDQRMREARDGGKVYGTERIAVMSALNLIHEFLQERREQSETADTVRRGIGRLTEKIDAALARRN